ncbi:hypothetical protein ACFW6Q_25830 [Streptomyces sp. NPDC058737]|uniref:hypothetical protein n=1 Tax=Streptomyces sp. NPDC058737 TaxID=3346617 RepID=UPI00368C2FA8
MSSGETDGLHEEAQCRPTGEGASSSAAPARSGRRTGDEDGQDSNRPEGDAAAGETRDSGPQPEGGFWHKQNRTLEIVGAVVTVVAGVAGLIFLFWPDVQPKPEPEPAPAVELVDSDVDREQNVAADVVFDGQVTDRARVPASVVSATLRNSADNPVLITRAEVNLVSATEVSCPYGAGPTDITAQYDIKIPAEAREGVVIARKMKYTLPPHAQERVAFTVGPERYGEGSMPWIYTFTISLYMDDGATVTVPEVTYLAPTDMATAFVAMADQATDPPQAGGPGLMDPSCISKQARSVAQLVKSAPRPSPELREFSADLARVAAQ